MLIGNLKRILHRFEQGICTTQQCSPWQRTGDGSLKSAIGLTSYMPHLILHGVLPSEFSLFIQSRGVTAAIDCTGVYWYWLDSCVVFCAVSYTHLTHATSHLTWCISPKLFLNLSGEESIKDVTDKRSDCCKRLHWSLFLFGSCCLSCGTSENKKVHRLFC